MKINILFGFIILAVVFIIVVNRPGLGGESSHDEIQEESVLVEVEQTAESRAPVAEDALIVPEDGIERHHPASGVTCLQDFPRAFLREEDVTNVRALYESLRSSPRPLRRGEFETSAEYQERMAEVEERHGGCVQNGFFVIEGNLIRYDPDNEVYSARVVPSREIRSAERIHTSTHMGQTGVGRRLQFTHDEWEVYHISAGSSEDVGISEVRLDYPLDEARVKEPQFKSYFVYAQNNCVDREGGCWSSVESSSAPASVRMPRQYVRDDNFVYAEIIAVMIVDADTREVGLFQEL